MALKIYGQIRKIRTLKRGEHDDSKLLKGERAVFKCLAVAAHEDGTSIYCSVPFIMDDTGYSRWWVQKCLRELERKGFIISVSSRSGGRGHPIGYRIPLNEFAQITPQPQARDEEEEQEEQEEQPAAAAAISPPPAVVTRRSSSPPAPAPADEPFLDAEYVELKENLDLSIEEIEKYQRQMKVWTRRLHHRQRLYEQKLASHAPPDDIKEAQDLISDARDTLAELARAAPGALEERNQDEKIKSLAGDH